MVVAGDRTMELPIGVLGCDTTPQADGRAPAGASPMVWAPRPTRRARHRLLGRRLAFPGRWLANGYLRRALPPYRPALSGALGETIVKHKKYKRLARHIAFPAEPEFLWEMRRTRARRRGHFLRRLTPGRMLSTKAQSQSGASCYGLKDGRRLASRFLDGMLRNQQVSVQVRPPAPSNE
jgi:hypothetical protein